MIDASILTTDALEGFDDMMCECVTKVENFAPLAGTIWTEILRELDVRGRAQLISGTYENIGDALIRRIR